MPAKSQIKTAQEAIRHFEKDGRMVVGVSISRDSFKLEFAQNVPEVTQADLVNMAEK